MTIVIRVINNRLVKLKFDCSFSGFAPPRAVDRPVVLGILRLALQTGPTSVALLFDKS